MAPARLTNRRMLLMRSPLKSLAQSGQPPRLVKIATWNINSLKTREDQVLDWLEQNEPDVLCLQETKVTDQEFPEDGFFDLDYEAVYFGQKTYNGVAIVSREPLEDVQRGFDSEGDDDDKRLIAGTYDGIRIVCIYMPNGQAVGTDKYDFKLGWMAEMRRYLDAGPGPDTPLVLTGDFNIAPHEGDHHSAVPGDDTIFVSAKEIEAYRRILDWGLTDTLHHLDPSPKQYTWWDYRSGSWERNYGMRIDHVLLTQALLPRAKSVTVHREVRGWERASDHVPVVLELED